MCLAQGPQRSTADMILSKQVIDKHGRHNEMPQIATSQQGL